LKNEAISLEARILSVADVIEAMASHRPYRAGLGIEKALLEIEQNHDNRFDIDIVQATLKLFRHKGFTLNID
jgi:HD-GYP domain-containing protein (c-di-GMP phosphodiesterase class II)